MKTNTEQVWIEKGYELFALEGPKGLNIEALARKVGKSKSSFYHLFVDVAIFQEALLKHHTQRSKEIALEAKACQNMVPDFINLGLTIKNDLLFNRQLRINRSNASFKNCAENANATVEVAFIDIWIKLFGPDLKPEAARKLLKITVENFYLQINEDTFTYEWMLSFLGEIQETIISLIKN